MNTEFALKLISVKKKWSKIRSELTRKIIKSKNRTEYQKSSIFIITTQSKERNRQWEKKEKVIRIAYISRYFVSTVGINDKCYVLLTLECCSHHLEIWGCTLLLHRQFCIANWSDRNIHSKIQSRKRCKKVWKNDLKNSWIFRFDSRKISPSI